MIQRIGFVLLTTIILTACQGISKQELEVIQTRAAQAEQLESDNITLKTKQLSLVQTVKQLNKELEQEVKTKQVLIEQNKAKKTIKVVLQQSILFSSGSYKLDQPEAAAILKKVVASLDQNKNIKIGIVGHTDNLPVSKKWRNQFSDNWDLSSRRAGEVARYFVWGAGVPRENITVVGRADAEPVASNDTEQGRAKNRRIEIFLGK